MSVNLKKGQRVELKKEQGGNLHRVMVGLGWDAVKKSSFFFSNPIDIDCDATAFLCKNDKLTSIDDIVYFGNLKHFTNTVIHMGDNLTGDGDGDDEQILVDLERLPLEYNKIVFVVNIYKAKERNQDFGMIKNAFIRICDGDTGKEFCKYNLSENYSGMTAMIFGELYRHNNIWKFNAIGLATKDNDIGSLENRFINN